MEALLVDKRIARVILLVTVALVRKRSFRSFQAVVVKQQLESCSEF